MRNPWPDEGEGYKILAITNDYPTADLPGNAPCIKDQLSTLKDNGVHVDLLHIDRNKGKARSYGSAALKMVWENFRSRRYDLVHAFYGHCGLIARLQIRYPVVITYRGSDLLSKRDGFIGKLAARFANGVIVMSEEMARASGRADARIIPFGVNTELFHPQSRHEARRMLELPLEEKIVLFPYDPKRPGKRFDVVEQAVELLERDIGRVRLEIVFKAPHHVMARYMNAADTLVLASSHEGAPMAVREAMACNLPVVSVDVGDVRSVIGDTEECYICSRNPRDIATHLGLVLKRGKRTDGAKTVNRLDTVWAAREVLSVYRSVVRD
jgi:glycosyltransferase involved in cell wall biosynthesis